MSVFSPNVGNTDQNNSEYGHFLCSLHLVNAVEYQLSTIFQERKFRLLAKKQVQMRHQL